MSLAVETIRGDFPALALRTPGGQPLVYLDNAATTQKPLSVLAAMDDFYRHANANVRRGIYALSEEATRRYEQARKQVAEFLGCGAGEVVFTRGTTESINLVAYGWGRRFVQPGDSILVTEMEHHSNLIPWQVLARDRGARLQHIPVSPAGELDLAATERLLAGAPRLLAMTWTSNVLGCVNPVADLTRMAHAHGVPVLLDGAQAAPHFPTRVQEVDCDFLAFSGHKMLGPPGIGVLYAKPQHLAAMEPMLYGGEMINQVDFTSASWAEPPQKFEGGTPNSVGAIGLGAAIEYLRAAGWEAIQRHVADLTRAAVTQLQEIPGVRILRPASPAGGLVSFVVEGIHPHDLAQFLDQRGIALRAGHMCAQPLLRKLGVGVATRASFQLYNTAAEVTALAQGVAAAREYF